MFQKKEKKQEPQKPVEVEEVEEVAELEEMEENDELDKLPKTLKKKEVSTELTEDMVRKALENLLYRVGKIEHNLRLDY